MKLYPQNNFLQEENVRDLDEIYPENVSTAASLLESWGNGTPPSPVLLASDQGQEGVLVSFPAFTGSDGGKITLDRSPFSPISPLWEETLRYWGEVTPPAASLIQCSSHFIAGAARPRCAPPPPLPAAGRCALVLRV